MKEDDFIGFTIKTLEVVGWDGSRNKGGAKEYLVRCTECAKDPEMFGDGLFKSTKARISEGRMPCGCAPTPIWSEEQYKTKVNRKCAELGYELVNFSEEFNGQNTRVSLHCAKHNFSWSQTCKAFLSGNSTCPKCNTESRRQSDEQMITKIVNTGKFVLGTVFWRTDPTNPSRDSKWSYQCPVCSSDEYVEAGLCTGVFSARYADLARGIRSCRCAPNIKRTKEQAEYHVKKILAGDGHAYEFIGWSGEYKGVASKLRLWCKDHGEFGGALHDFLSASARCAGCATCGYDSTKPGNIYILKCDDISKIGITNRCVHKRASNISRSFEDDFTVHEYWSFDDGRIPRLLENAMKAELKEMFEQPDRKFDGYTECFIGADVELMSDMVRGKIAELQ